VSFVAPKDRDGPFGGVATLRGVTPRSDKRTARADAIARRAALSDEEREAASALVVGRLRRRLPAAGPVMTFSSIRDELDLAPLNRELRAAGRLVLPRVEGRRLAAVLTGPATEMVTSAWGIPEPVGPELDPTTIDLVIVPGLAFDAQGHRIGYGAGYYDRFLPLLRPDATTIGVCFAAQLGADLPVEPHDVAVRSVVTETGSVAGRAPEPG